MPRMKTCANCATRYPYADKQCPNCAKTVGSIETRCVFNDHGDQCWRRGSLSPNTNGSGPWYCSDHAWVFLGGEPDHRKRSAEPDIAAEAAKYCGELGLDTVEKMKAFVKLNLPRIDKRSAKV